MEGHNVRVRVRASQILSNCKQRQELGDALGTPAARGCLRASSGQERAGNGHGDVPAFGAEKVRRNVTQRAP